MSEPLAQEHIIIKCVVNHIFNNKKHVKEETKKVIVIKNPYPRTVVYTVETDLVNSWGENRVEILGN